MSCTISCIGTNRFGIPTNRLPGKIGTSFVPPGHKHMFFQSIRIVGARYPLSDPQPRRFEPFAKHRFSDRQRGSALSRSDHIVERELTKPAQGTRRRAVERRHVAAAAFVLVIRGTASHGPFEHSVRAGHALRDMPPYQWRSLPRRCRTYVSVGEASGGELIVYHIPTRPTSN